MCPSIQDVTTSWVCRTTRNWVIQEILAQVLRASLTLTQRDRGHLGKEQVVGDFNHMKCWQFFFIEPLNRPWEMSP